MRSPSRPSTPSPPRRSPGSRATGRHPAAIAAGLATGTFLTWNVSNVGAVAEPLAATYGVSLAAVGLLTAALFATHLLAQLPAGRGADRVGPRTVALAACGAAAVGNVLLLASTDYALALLGRAIVGLGSGAGFVAGLDLVRAGGGGPAWQGTYGGGTMAGGGLALMVLPALTEETSWRAPYWTAILLAGLAAIPVLAARGLVPVGRAHGGPGVVEDRRLLPLGLLQAATFGLAVVAGNWVVTLLERQGTSTALAGLAGSAVLFAGIVTRPGGGLLVRSRPGLQRPLVAGSLVAGSAGSLLLAAGISTVASAAGALLLGLGAGLPFATIFQAAQRLRPDAPGAASAFVNGVAVLTILVGTPLAGLAFSGPGDGAWAFVAIGGLLAASLLVLRRAAL